MAATFATIDDYVASFPKDVQAVLEQVRQTIRNAVPSPGETISYQMPAITYEGEVLVYFAGWKHHVGFYPPIPTMDSALEAEVAPFRGPKGNLQFPLDEPIPYDLIGRLVAIQVDHRAQTRH